MPREAEKKHTKIEKAYRVVYEVDQGGFHPPKTALTPITYSDLTAISLHGKVLSITPIEIIEHPAFTQAEVDEVIRRVLKRREREVFRDAPARGMRCKKPKKKIDVDDIPF